MQRRSSGTCSWLMLMAVLLTTLNACSSSKKSALIPLNSTRLAGMPTSPTEKGDQSFMQLKSTIGKGTTTGFVTALRTCGYDKKTSLRGTTRQIFVGLEQVKITHQDAAEFPPLRLWYVEAEAQSEGLPIDMSTYTLKQDQCFVDFVLWTLRPSSEEKQPAFHEELADLRSQFHDLVGETLPQL